MGERVRLAMLHILLRRMLRTMLHTAVVSDVADHIHRPGGYARKTGALRPVAHVRTRHGTRHIGESAFVAPRPFSAVFPGRVARAIRVSPRGVVGHVTPDVASNVAGDVAEP